MLSLIRTALGSRYAYRALKRRNYVAILPFVFNYVRRHRNRR